MIQVEKIQEFYLTNHDFQIFVNKNIQSYHRTLEQEFQNPITQEYYLSLLKGGCNEERDNGSEDPRSASAAGASSTCDS